MPMYAQCCVYEICRNKNTAAINLPETMPLLVSLPTEAATSAHASDQSHLATRRAVESEVFVRNVRVFERPWPLSSRSLQSLPFG